VIDSLIADLNSTPRILIYGAGIEGASSYRFLRAHCAEVTIGLLDQLADPNTLAHRFNAAKIHDPQNAVETLAEHYDRILIAPGISPEKLPADPTLHAKLDSQANLFLKHFGTKTLAITGTKGKTTTALLLAELLKAAGKSVALLGNMGQPAFEAIEADAPEWFVAELSSYQLARTRYSPHLAVVLNFHQEHLDYHLSYENYVAAKLSLARFQGANDHLFFHGDYREFGPLATRQNATDFSRIAIADLEAIGQQKQLFLHPDTLGVLRAVDDYLDLDRHAEVQALERFQRPPHRLEYLGQLGGKHLYNDSIATIPSATIHAVTALGRVDALILGGFDRQIDYAPFMQWLTSAPVAHTIFTGPAGKRMMSHLPRDDRFRFEARFDNAARLALTLTPTGGTCLLSPAASSYNEFKNYTERGARFGALADQSP
jgi:UDP-N-acetylmuramoylalanine--D-glutamate ligase